MAYKNLLGVLAVVYAMIATPVQAQQSVALESDAKVVRVVEGVESLEEPKSVMPGDRLVFTTRYRNDDDYTVENFVVTNPLPGPVKLAEDGAFEVSVDGGKNFAPLAATSVTEGEVRRPATVEDVTHLRWTIANIPSGKTGEIKYFAVVR